MMLQNKWQLVVVVAMMLTTLAMQAATVYHWQTDIGSGEWSDSAKWTPAGVPGVDDTAYFTRAQTAPFTVSFTADASAKLSLGSTDAAQPVNVTFDLNGYTLTHVTGALDANRALEWTILNGTLWSHTAASALNIGFYVTNAIPKVTIGSGATYLHNGTQPINVGSQSEGELVIRDGGKLITEVSSGLESLRVGGNTPLGDALYTSKMTLTGSDSVWSNFVGSILLSNHARSTAELNVTDNGVLVHAGRNFMIGNASGANASLNIESGGVVDGRLASGGGYMSIGNTGTGTVTVTGSGSTLLAISNNVYFGNTANASQGTLIIEDGGLVEKMVGSHTMYLGYRNNSTGYLIVRDGGVLRWAGGFGTVAVGGVGTGAEEGSTGELTVTGAMSRAILGEFPIGQNRGSALVTVAGGGTLEAYRAMYVGRMSTNLVSHNGSAKLVVTGTGSVLKNSILTKTELPGASISTIISLGIGGCGFQGWNSSGLLYYPGYGPGGKGLAIIENGGLLDINGFIGVYSNSTLRIDGGHTRSRDIGLETNAVLNVVLRQDDANGTALMTASGEVRIWGATLEVERGIDFVPVAGDVYTLIEANSINATINRFAYDGAVLQDGDFIKLGGTTFKVGYTATTVTLTVRSPGTIMLVL